MSTPTALTVAGVAAGLLFGHKSFLWALLLAYIPTLLLPSALRSAGTRIRLTNVCGGQSQRTSGAKAPIYSRL